MCFRLPCAVAGSRCFRRLVTESIASVLTVSLKIMDAGGRGMVGRGAVRSMDSANRFFRVRLKKKSSDYYSADASLCRERAQHKVEAGRGRALSDLKQVLMSVFVPTPSSACKLCCMSAARCPAFRRRATPFSLGGNRRQRNRRMGTSARSCNDSQIFFLKAEPVPPIVSISTLYFFVVLFLYSSRDMLIY